MVIENTHRIIKHRGTYSPLQCEHCSLMWYGWHVSDKWMNNLVLCTDCYNALINYLGDHHEYLYDQRREEENTPRMQEITREWVANKNNKPKPRAPERIFHSSVPKWMRSAIRSGMVTAGDKLWYVVYSQDDQAIKVETTAKPTKR